MTRSRTHRTMPWVIGLTALLSACGGGGDGDNGDDSSAAPAAPAAAKSVFAVPAGPLCATTVAPGVCAQPTSSSTTTQALVAAFQKSGGDAIRFQSSDVQIDARYSMHNADATSSSGLTSLVDKTIDIHREAMVVGGVSYPFYKAGEAALPGAQYRVDEDNPAGWGVSVAGDIAVPSKAGTWSTTSGTYPDVTIEGEAHTWDTEIGLLTDQNDAPTDAEIVYAGGGRFGTGDRSLLGDPRYTNSLYGECPMTATFQPSSGLLKIAATRCVFDPFGISPLQVSFRIDDLNVLGSRIKPATGTRAQLSLAGNGIAFIGAPGSSDGPPLALTAEVTEIAGAVFQKNAKTIYVNGANSGGYFRIQLVRQ